MKRQVLCVLAAGAVAGIGCSAAAADPSLNNGHNCGGFASSFVPPGLGPEVSQLAHAFPTAVPSLLDFANCGANGFPPK